MATKYFKGQLTAIAQQVDCTPANVEIGDIFSVLIDGEVIASYVALSATVGAVGAALFPLWNASTDVRAATCTAVNNSGVLNLTADTAGMPFSVTCTATDGGGANTQTLTPSTTVANVSPNDASPAGNWSDGSVLTTGDVVSLENSAVSILHGLDQSAVTLASLTIKPTYTGRIGLYGPKFATNSSTHNAAKREYREEYFKIGATVFNMPVHVGAGNPSGASRVNIDFGSVQTLSTINATAQSSADDNMPPVRLLGTNASNKLAITGGTVGTAIVAGEVSTWSEITVSGGTLNCGSGCTLTTVNVDAGEAFISSAATTINLDGGKLTVNGTGATTTANCNGGELIYNSSGTITNLNIRGRVVLSSGVARTITNCSMYAGGSLICDEAATFTNGIDFIGCGIEDVSLNAGKNINIGF